MDATPERQVADLAEAIRAHVLDNKSKFLNATIGATRLLMIWIGYLRSNASSGNADRLLDAVQGTIIEVAGCLSLGLVRPAIFSIRTQLELLLAWVYFNDHSVEWRHIETATRDYPLRSFFIKYMSTYDECFSDRFKLLIKTKKRKDDDPYGILSVHVHSSSALAAPSVAPLSSMVRSRLICDECVQMQADVAEYLTDLLAAWFANRWHDLPNDITADLKSRFTPRELKEFCK